VDVDSPNDVRPDIEDDDCKFVKPPNTKQRRDYDEKKQNQVSTIISAEELRRRLRQVDSRDSMDIYTSKSVATRRIQYGAELSDDDESIVPLYSQRKRQRAETQDEEGEKEKPEAALIICSVCDKKPCHPPHDICTKCRLDMAKHNVLAPGKIPNRNGEIRDLCVVCNEAPRLKGGRKCSPCSYATNKNKCDGCNRTGIKLSKGLCNACNGRKIRQRKHAQEEERKRALESSDDERPKKKQRKENDDEDSILSYSDL
jgi:hypothetical protein